MFQRQKKLTIIQLIQNFIINILTNQVFTDPNLHSTVITAAGNHVRIFRIPNHSANHQIMPFQNIYRFRAVDMPDIHPRVFAPAHNKFLILPPKPALHQKLLLVVSPIPIEQFFLRDLPQMQLGVCLARISQQKLPIAGNRSRDDIIRFLELVYLISLLLINHQDPIRASRNHKQILPIPPQVLLAYPCSLDLITL